MPYNVRKTTTEVAEKLLAAIAELKKKYGAGVWTGAVGVSIIDMLVPDTALEACRIGPTQV